MAEAGQKDQTGNEGVAQEDANLDSARPQSLDDFTGISNAHQQSGAAQEISQPKDTAAPKDDAATPPRTNPPTSQGPEQPPKSDTSSSSVPKSKFLDNEWQSMLLRQAWHMEEIDAEFSSIIKGLKKNKDESLTFETDNGKFLWGKIAQQNGTGGFDHVEYIGLPSRFSRLTQELADDQMMAAKAHGWKAVNLHGKESNKEKMWLAAMRAGLEVENYLPPEGSPVLDIWKKESAEITGATNADQQKPAEPKAEEPKAAEPPKAEEPKAAEPPKAEEPKAAEPPKVEEPKAAEPPKAEEPKAAEPPKAEEPKAAEQPKAEAPVAPVASKFGTAEPPKAEEPKANAAHADWEAKRPSAPPDGEAPWRHEERMKYEAVEGMSKRAATVQDPTHRAGIEKLQDAIKSGKVSVDGPVEREIINNVDSPKGFQKAAEYFGKKADSDLGLPKVDTPTVADNTAPKNTAQKNKGPV